MKWNYTKKKERMQWANKIFLVINYFLRGRVCHWIPCKTTSIHKEFSSMWHMEISSFIMWQSETVVLVLV